MNDVLFLTKRTKPEVKKRFKREVFRLLLLLVTLIAIVASLYLPEKELGAQLAHKCARLSSVPEDGVPVIMLHGMTDSKETWKGIYQNVIFLNRRKVCIYDARNHGDSPWNHTFNTDVLADDLGSFMRANKIEKVALVGHSLGGLTAMKFALKNPQKVERIFVEDISPFGVPGEARVAIEFYIQLIKDSISAVPDGADEETARQAIIDYILEETDDISLGIFPEKFPLKFRDGKWQWKANFDAFSKALDDFDSFHGKMEGFYDGKVFFIYGKESWFKVANDQQATQKLFPNSEFFGVEGAGHIIHTKYREFLRELIKFLK